MTNIRFVQFPHRGVEHTVDPGQNGKGWNRLSRGRGRTFFQANGVRLSQRERITGPLWAWGEWEPEARVVRELGGAKPSPATLFDPYWTPKKSYRALHNTDPLVFGGFYYTDCRQLAFPGLRVLDAGSVIVFGSKLEDWVVDAVLVLSEHVDHDVSDHRQRIHNLVPDGFQEVVLEPIYAIGEAGNPRRRLYIGATHDRPFNGMFSFFPCMPSGDATGFARPKLQLSAVLTRQHFNPLLGQGCRGSDRNYPALTLAEVTQLWEEVRDQVVAQGCDLGVWADMPPRRDAET